MSLKHVSLIAKMFGMYKISIYYCTSICLFKNLEHQKIKLEI